MCRNIRTLHNFEPPATHEEVHASALQFVRKIAGFTRPVEGQRGGLPARRRRGDATPRIELLDGARHHMPRRAIARSRRQGARALAARFRTARVPS